MAEEAPPTDLCTCIPSRISRGGGGLYRAPGVCVCEGVQRGAHHAVLYGITFVMMTAKFLILFAYSHETPVGERRCGHRNVSLLRYLADSPRILRDMLHNRRIMLTVGLIACFATVKTCRATSGPAGDRQAGIAAVNCRCFPPSSPC
jgi:hypothetical protein